VEPRKIESTGKTIDDAIMNGLEELGLSLDEVEIEVIREGTKGLFGFGGKSCVVQLTQKLSVADYAVDFIQGLCSRMKVEAKVTATENEDNIMVDLSGERMGILIGHRGETLDSIQYLTNLAVNGKDYGKRIIVDTENYRAKRVQALEKLAKRLASKVKATGRSMSLEPMAPYERRVLHATLQDNPYVTTSSEGEDSNRRVVISPK
jgi:spoIIIJ-associated protein